MRLNETLSGILAFIFGVAVFGYARTFPAASGQPIGPAFFPQVLGGALAVCGIVLAWSGRKEPAAPWVKWDGWVRQPRRLVNFGAVVGALVFYAVGVDTIGFHVASLIILGGLFLAFEVRARWGAPLALAITCGLHFAFYTLLRVPLPWGWLEEFAW